MAQQNRTPSTIPGKIQPPRLEHVYARTRLFRELDEAFSRPLVWIGAPAGAGKTTLAASYLQHRKLKPLWYQVDEGDADVASFFYYLGLLGRHAAPRRKTRLPLLTPEYLRGVPTFARNFFREFFDRLRVPGVVVLDNFQMAGNDSELNEILPILVSEAPEGCTVLVLSRTQPPPSLARSRVARQIALIDWDAMRLTADEAGHIAQAHRDVRRGPVHNKTAVQRMHEQSQGWAAGLILLLEQESESPDSGTEDVNETVFDYFAAEIMRSARPDVQEFLVHASLLPEMDVASTAALTGNPQSAEILRGLARRNHFTVRRPGETTSYQFHPLFREFLLAELRRRMDPDKLRQVQRKAARILAQQGSYESAAAIFASVADANGLSDLVLSQGQTLIRQGRHPLLAQWVEAIPEAHQEAQPLLLYWRGLAIQWHDPFAARACFSRAFDAFSDGRDARMSARIWAAAVDTYLISFSEFHSLDHWIDQLGFFTPERFASLPEEVYAHLAAAIFIALTYRQPDHTDLPVWAAKAEQIFHSTDSPGLRFYIGNHLLLYLMWWVGDTGRAHTLLESLPTSRRGIDPRMEILHSAFRAGLCWKMAENQDGIEAAAQGLAQAARTGMHVWDAFLICQAAFASLAANDLPEAERYIDRILARVDHGRYLETGWAMYSKAWYQELVGDPDAAIASLRYAREQMDRAGTPYYAAVVYNELGRLLAQRGQHDEGMALVAEAGRLAEAMDSDPIRYHVARSRAEIALHDGDDAACAKASREYLAIGKRRCFCSHAGWRAGAMARLYAKALEYDIEPEFVTQVIKRRQLCPPADLPGSDAWPYPVKVQTFGRFSLLVSGQRVKMERKTQQKPVTLLKLLVALGGTGIPEDQLCDILWPDAEADNARHSLKTTLHRLRRIIGADSVTLHDGKLSLDRRYVWSDSWTVDELLDRGRKALRTDDVGNALAIGRRLFLLCKAPYLDGEDLAPFYGVRERYRARTLAFLGELARKLSAIGNQPESIVWYRAGLEIDPLTEQFYQGLIRCHLELGEAAEALKVYGSCRDILQRELGLAPAPTTEALAGKAHAAPA